MPARTSASRRFGPIAPTGRSTKVGATRLPSEASRPPWTDTGTITRSDPPLRGLLPLTQQAVERAADRREHHVVHGPAEPILDVLEPLERSLGDREPAVRADPDVERRGRPRPHVEDAAQATQHRPGVDRGERRRAPNRIDGRHRRLHRVSEDGFGRLPQQLLRGGFRLRRPGRRRRIRTRVRRQVEDRRREVHAGQPVDHRVMDLHERGHVAVLEPLDHVELPERFRAVERAREDPLDLLRQLGPPPGARQGGPPDVEAEVERRIVDPDRVCEVERHHLHPLPEPRCQMQSRGDDGLHVLEPQPAVRAGRGVEHGQARDVHVHRGPLEVQEGRVERGQTFGGHGPPTVPLRGPAQHGC